MSQHGSMPTPPDRRPCRRQSETGHEQTAYTVDATGRVTRLTLRQIGWQGQSGAFYALDGDANPMDHEPGSFSPILVAAHADDMAPEDFMSLVVERVRSVAV